MKYTIVVSAPASALLRSSSSRRLRAARSANILWTRAASAYHLRRSFKTRGRLPRALAFASSPAGREAYPGRYFLSSFPAFGTRRATQQRTWRRVLDRTSIIETKLGDVSAYVPTNVISITDGQIYLESGLFYQGIRPAVNVGLSVSRVGFRRADQGREESGFETPSRARAVPRTPGVRAVCIRPR